MTEKNPVWAEPLAISGWGVTSVLGVGKDAFVKGMTSEAEVSSDPSDLFDDPLPKGYAFPIQKLDVKGLLGKKGVSFLDRTTVLALITCGEALEDAGVIVNDETRDSVGVVLGTTAGSMRATSEYSRATYVEDRPYLVNPLIFPNAVMNCSAAQAAIRFGLRGVNSTVAGDVVAFASALAYARTITAAGRAQGLVVGAAEEYAPQTAWSIEHARRLNGYGVPAGEGAAAFFVEAEASATDGGRTPAALILAAGVRSCAPEDISAFVEEILLTADVSPAEVDVVFSGEIDGEAPTSESAALDKIFDDTPRTHLLSRIGEVGSADGALSLAAVLATSAKGTLAVITAVSRDGVTGAIVVRTGERQK